MNKIKPLLTIPKGPRSILKGSSLKDLLDEEAIECLGKNISTVYPKFKTRAFANEAFNQIGPLGITERGHRLPHVLRKLAK